MFIPSYSLLGDGEPSSGIYWKMCFRKINLMFSSVQSPSHVRLFATPWIAARQDSVRHQLPEFTQTHIHWVGEAIQPSHPLSSPSPASNPSQHQTFQMSQLFTWGGQSTGVSALASVLPMNTGLVSMNNGLVGLLAVQGPLKSLLQHHNSKASIPLCSAFFTVQIWYPYMTTRNTIA